MELGLGIETNYVPITGGRRVVLMINGLGATPLMELMIAAGKAVPGLQLELGVTVERVYVGSFMTSLDMAGFSITVMKADQSILNRLDAPARAPNWPVSVDGNHPPAKIPVPVPPSCFKKNIETFSRPGQILVVAIEAAATATNNFTDNLNELDNKVGDGDCGSTMSNLERDCKLRLSIDVTMAYLQSRVEEHILELENVFGLHTRQLEMQLSAAREHYQRLIHLLQKSNNEKSDLQRTAKERIDFITAGHENTKAELIAARASLQLRESEVTMLRTEKFELEGKHVAIMDRWIADIRRRFGGDEDCLIFRLASEWYFSATMFAIGLLCCILGPFYIYDAKVKAIFSLATPLSIGFIILSAAGYYRRDTDMLRIPPGWVISVFVNAVVTAVTFIISVYFKSTTGALKGFMCLNAAIFCLLMISQPVNDCGILQVFSSQPFMVLIADARDAHGYFSPLYLLLIFLYFVYSSCQAYFVRYFNLKDAVRAQSGPSA
ncbi:hypothetical protein OROHE_022703 [Orobanche hederae]